MARTTDPLSDVEKAIKAYDKAEEAAEVAARRHDEAVAAQKRAHRELNWYASHPSLPDDFELEKFREELQAPFTEPDVESKLADQDEAPLVEHAVGRSQGIDLADDEDDDDPFN